MMHRDKLSYELSLVHLFLSGGDQMTCARIRGSQRIRSNSERRIDRLTGIVGVTEDWHAKMCFMGVRTNLFGALIIS